MHIQYIANMGSGHSKKKKKCSFGKGGDGSGELNRETSGRRSPPRGLSGILSDPDYTEAFRQYLTGIDKKRGDDANLTRLNFVIRASALCDVLNAGGGGANLTPDALRLCDELRAEFFAAGRTKVALEPKADARRLEEQLDVVLSAQASPGVDAINELKRAASAAKEDARLQLDDLQQRFLKRRAS